MLWVTPRTADADIEEAVRRTVAIYRKLQPHMVGDFYPLFPHTDCEEAWFGCQFHRPELNAGAAILFRRGKSKDARMSVPLRALVPKRSYDVSFEPVSAAGRRFSFPGLRDTLLSGAEQTMNGNESFYSGERASPRALICLKGLTNLGSRGRSPSRVLALGFLLLLLPFGALADGKMISAFPANVTMPDQQALIHFTNGTERLVIETRFTGAGTNFAWVVPLPSKPVVEAATTGLFPTLRYLFQPRIIHQVPPYYVGFLMAIGAVALLYVALRGSGARAAIGLLLGLPLLALSALVLMALEHPGGPNGSPAEGAVSILDRRVVGVFDTTTLASQDPKALQNWLRENGFSLPVDTAPVIESYVKEGWVFVTAKVRREQPGLQISTPHPLSFTFKSARPVYPMRLTGINNGPLSVELYVFGPGRASARHFKTQCCTQPGYQEPEEWWTSYRTSRTLKIVHPLLRRWVGGAPVATRLTATLTPANMRQDVWLDWEPFREQSSRVYSREAAWAYALNSGAGLFAAVLFVALIAANANQRIGPRLRKVAAAVTIAGVALTGILYLALPKTEVRLVQHPGYLAERQLHVLYSALQEETNLTPSTVEAIVLGLTNSPHVKEWSRYHDSNYRENLLLGETLRQEDSPGNYILRQSATGLEFIGYDFQGTERVLGSIPR